MARAARTTSRRAPIAEIGTMILMVIAAAAGGAPAPAQPGPAKPAASDRIAWTLRTKAPSYGSGAAGDIDGDGRPEIVFGTYFNDEHLYAVNAEDGSVLWKYKSKGGPIDTSVLVYDVNSDGRLEVIFGDSAYGTLYCLDGKGSIVWTFDGQSGTDSPAAAADLDGDGTVEVVYGTMVDYKLGKGTGHLNVLNGRTGEPRWSVEVPGHVQSEPALVDLNMDGVLDVVVANWRGDDHLRAFDGSNGETLWSFRTGDSIYHGVSFFDFDQDDRPELVLADRKGSVWLLEGESGETKWKATLEGEREGSVFAPTSLVDSDADGIPEIVVCGQHVHLLDARDGRVRWRAEYGPNSIARGVAVADVNRDGVDDLLFGQGQKLRAIRSDTGAELWAVDIKSGDDLYENVDHAPLIFDADGDGSLDVFVVSGRGLSGETQAKNYGLAVLIRTELPTDDADDSDDTSDAAESKTDPNAGERESAGPENDETGGWLMFRGGPRHSGRCENGQPIRPANHETDQPAESDAPSSGG